MGPSSSSSSSLKNDSNVKSQDLPSPRISLMFKTICYTVLWTLLLAGPAVGWWVFAFRHNVTTFDVPNLLVRTTAPPTRFLLLATVSATVTKFLVGPLMLLHAYTASADWISSSKHNEIERLPSPVQLGTLHTLTQTATTKTAARTGWSWFSPGLPWPPMLKKAFVLLCWLLVLSNGIDAVSVYLQFDAKPETSIPATSNFGSLGLGSVTPDNALYSRMINQTLCTEQNAVQLKSAYNAAACGLTDGTAATKDNTASRASEIYNNNSDVSPVAWLNDNTAILTTANPPTIGYKAKALGVRASCKTLTEQCVQCNRTKPNVLVKCEAGSSGPLRLACHTSGTVVNAPALAAGYIPHGPIPSKNGSEMSRDFDANPFAHGDVMSLDAAAFMNRYPTAGAIELKLDYFVGGSGFLVHGRRLFNVIHCDISVFDVTYQYASPDKYTVLSSALANISTAAYVAFGMTAWPWNTIPGRNFSSLDIEGAGLGADSTYADTITILGFGIRAIYFNYKVRDKYMATARGRLVSSFPLIADLFGGLNLDYQTHEHATSAGTSHSDFAEGNEADRMEIRQSRHGQTVRLRTGRVGGEVVGAMDDMDE